MMMMMMMGVARMLEPSCSSRCLLLLHRTLDTRLLNRTRVVLGRVGKGATLDLTRALAVDRRNRLLAVSKAAPVTFIDVMSDDVSR